jgi:hypothetical protein
VRQSARFQKGKGKEEDTVNFVLVASRAKDKRTGNMFFFSVFIVAEQMANN